MGGMMQEDPGKVWAQCLDTIEKMINRQTFETWFRPTKGIHLTQDTFTIQVPNQFFADWLEEHHLPMIKKVLRKHTGPDIVVAFEVSEIEPQPITGLPPSKPFVPPRQSEPPVPPYGTGDLYPGYTFENFVVGSCNQFAHAASLAVVESPGKSTFNPLVIYGGVGLGKTHLAQAIAHASTAYGTVDRLRYVSSEQFTIEFINSIQDMKTKEFAKTYRDLDMLLVDDIQFFCHGRKDRTQEEFFHTFDVLRQNGKQIVLTCDRLPKELTGLEERLVSRFQWGLVTDIQPPDYETRVAILQKKAEKDGLSINPEVTAFIADQITSNIRDLEGAVLRLLAYASLFQCDISIDVAKQVLKDTFKKQDREVEIEDIQKAVAKQFSLPVDILTAKTRRKEVVLARQVAMYLCRQMTKESLKEIGNRFGGRDHTTVIHACQAIDEMMLNPEFQGMLDRITKSV